MAKDENKRLKKWSAKQKKKLIQFEQGMKKFERKVKNKTFHSWRSKCSVWLVWWSKDFQVEIHEIR